MISFQTTPSLAFTAAKKKPKTSGFNQIITELTQRPVSYTSSVTKAQTPTKKQIIFEPVMGTSGSPTGEFYASLVERVSGKVVDGFCHMGKDPIRALRRLNKELKKRG